MQDPINLELLGRYMTGKRLERVMVEEQIDSTNRLLKEMAQAGAKDGQIIIANEQSLGRGRLGRSFFSPKDQGIYLSVLFRPDDNAYEMAPLTAWAAVAVANAIETVCEVRPQIKWVNDLVMNGKKICGIMTELAVKEDGKTVDYVVIGVGVNVNGNSDDFPDSLKGLASTIQQECGSSCSRAQLAAEIIRELDLLAENWQVETPKYLADYKEGCITIGKEVKVITMVGERAATAIDIENDFSLRVRYEDETEECVKSGEVSVRGLYGYTGC